MTGSGKNLMSQTSDSPVQCESCSSLPFEPIQGGQLLEVLTRRSPSVLGLGKRADRERANPFKTPTLESTSFQGRSQSTCSTFSTKSHIYLVALKPKLLHVECIHDVLSDKPPISCLPTDLYLKPVCSLGVRRRKL